MANPELAAAAARAAEAAAAAVTAAAAASGAVAGVPAVSSSTGGIGGGGGGEGGGGRKPTAATDVREAAVKAAADRAAAAGRLLVPEIPALASMLHQQLNVPKERVKRLLLKWPRLLEVSLALESIKTGSDRSKRGSLVFFFVLEQVTSKQCAQNLEISQSFV